MGYRDYSTAKGHIVDATGHGDFTTIAAALAAASSGQTIFVRDGTYTENLTMVPGVRLTAFSQLSPTVTIIGKLTFTTAGSYYLSNLNLQTNSDFAVSCTGASACTIGIYNCGLTGSNNTIIQFSNSNASSKIDIYQCNLSLSTTGITYFTHSSNGVLAFSYSITSNAGGSTTATTHSAGEFILNYSALLAPYANSGTTAFINATNSIFNTSVQNATACTIGSTIAADNNIVRFCDFESGSASSISISASATLTFCEGSVQSSNTNAITGAGTIKYTGIGFCGTSSTVNTTTKTQMGFFPKVSPTVQVLTSGTAATYTTPANCQWIKIRMIGGGGGGAGTGTGGTAGNGGAGTASTWSGGSLSAGGGSGGTTVTGGAGGTSSNGDVNLAGAQGGPRWSNAIAAIGGYGGNGFFGGGGQAGEANGGVGGGAAANTGGGGGGAGSTTTTVTSGSGGGSGGYVEKIINSPSATYTYTVGASGGAGTAGTSGVAGGAGGSGIIIVEEYYL